MAMDENPYEAPKSMDQVVGILSGRREDLRKVAQYQKGILICILIYIVAVVGQFLIPPSVRTFLVFAILALGVVSTVFVFLLAIQVYKPALGILMGILALVPCLGLIVLLLLSSKATKILKDNGIPVGLLGADLSRI